MSIPNDTKLDFWLAENEPRAVDLLKRIDTLASTLRPKYDLRCGRGSASQTTDTQLKAVKAGATATGIDSRNIDDSLIRQMAFASLYEIGSTTGLLARFRWTRFTAIAESLDVFKYSVGLGYINAAYLQARAVLELCGSVALLCKDLGGIELNEETPQQVSTWMIEVAAATGQRGGGTKVDWENIQKNGLVKGKSRSYKPNEDTQDRSAVDLMKGIDLVDKKVKGARHCYDYLSEYAHPNVGIISTGIKDHEEKTLPNGFELKFRTYSTSSIGPISVDGSIAFFVEILEILESTLVLLVQLDKELFPIETKLSECGKKLIRLGLRNYPDIFQSAYPCPCFSGKIVSACCGRAIRLG